MNELQRLTNRIKYAKFLSQGGDDDRYYDVNLWHRGEARICSWTGHILRYQRCGLVWLGGDVQPEHDRLVDDFLYNNYQALHLCNKLVDQVKHDNDP